jgi:hypothetical protein
VRQSCRGASGWRSICRRANAAGIGAPFEATTQGAPIQTAVQRARDRPTISQAMEVAGGRVSSPGGAAARLG